MPLQIKMEETYIFKKGEEKGEKRGEKRGIKNTKIEAIAKLLKIGKLSIEEIAISFDVSVNFVKKIQKEMLKD
jgi:predicted transposase YdaD